jgi:hypothetical protein
MIFENFMFDRATDRLCLPARRRAVSERRAIVGVFHRPVADRLPSTVIFLRGTRRRTRHADDVPSAPDQIPRVTTRRDALAGTAREEGGNASRRVVSRARRRRPRSRARHAGER